MNIEKSPSNDVDYLRRRVRELEFAIEALLLADRAGSIGAHIKAMDALRRLVNEP